MASITLPNEVMIEIIREMEHRKDLVSLVSCCRLFRELGEPFLYSSFFQGSRTGVAAFFRTLLERPSLGQHIKVFSWSLFQRGSSDDSVPEINTHIFTPENRAQVLKIIADSAIGQEEEQMLVHNLYKNCNQKYFMAFALLLLPNLKILDLDDDCCLAYLPKFFARLSALQHSPDAPVCYHFSNLSSVFTLGCNSGGFTPLRSVMPLLDFKTIKTLAIESPYEWEEDPEARMQIFSRPNSAQDLSIKGECMGSQELGAFLRCFKDLRRLEYYNYLRDMAGHLFDFQGEEVYRAILPVKSQLEKLVLHRSPSTLKGRQGVAEHDVEDARYQIGPLTDFEKLTHLDITSLVLLGQRLAGNSARPGIHYAEDKLRSVANLPSSLKHLVIRDCDKDVYVALELILSNPTLIASLTTIIITFTSTDHPQETSEPWLSLHKEFLDKTCRLFLLWRHQRIWDAETGEFIPECYEKKPTAITCEVCEEECGISREIRRNKIYI